MSERRDHLDGVAMAIMVVLCATWGLQQVTVKIAAESIPVVLQSGLRSVGATFLLWAWCAMRRVPLFDRDGSLPFGLIAGFLFGAEFLFLFIALDHTTAGRVVLFLYMSPFVVAVGAHFFVPGERLSVRQVVGLTCAFCGTGLALLDGLRPGTGDTLYGDVLAIVAAVLWGATTVVIKGSRLATVRASKTLFYQLAVSGIMLMPAAFLLGETWPTAITPVAGGALAFQTVIVAFVSYLTWFWLVAKYPAGRLTSFSFLTPLFGMLFGALILDEEITLLLGLALVLVAIGIWLVNRRPSAAVSPAGGAVAGGKVLRR